MDSKIRILNIQHDSIVDGVGLRTVIFFAGCTHKCFKCHNPQSWDFNSGKEMTVEEVLDEIKSNPLVTGVTFSGGCCMCNADNIIPLAKALKKSEYNIWAYCGETFEQLTGSQLELLKYIDVLVDGRFIEEQRDTSLSFKGSKNQRLIDAQESLKQNRVVEILLYW